MIVGSSYGGTTVEPSVRAISSARSMRCAVVVPANSMRAPNRSAPARLATVTVVGITTVAGTPNRRAAKATACAWLPDDGAITPRAHRPRPQRGGSALEFLDPDQRVRAGDGGGH